MREDVLDIEQEIIYIDIKNNTVNKLLTFKLVPKQEYQNNLGLYVAVFIGDI